jgi:hypothetical protein
MRRASFLFVGTAGFLTLTVGGVAAATPPRFAIIISPNDGATPADVSRFEARLGHEIIGRPPYQLVTRDRLYAAIREQGLSNSAYADPSAAAKLGKIVGATHILHVTIGVDVERSEGLVMRETYDVSSDYEVIEVSTARIVSNGTGDGNEERRAAGGGDFTASALKTRQSAIDSCAEDIIGQITIK